MRAFISFSINDKDQYILTLLSSKLRQKNFIITTRQNFHGAYFGFSTKSQIAECHLFIGIITRQSLQRNIVLEEWKYAKKCNIPNILLIEDSINVQDTFKGNYVKFNRKNPQSAVEYITGKMVQNKAQPSKKSDDIVPWLLGGAALLAILGLLSNDGKK